ncbi:class I SAM-dependent methyltransferase [Paenibacillus sonchi]|uniref:class I SAM-dependent methyltransferase n=1 Tax=Paenibacillus sonchi TaxID=373687 RepID=UPI001E473879|nr:class I SAM-dependent methyltransferase [Paenibacillus sonchi]MCE3203996.1 class I SAM-dependent methyltransferase [Paenibacillus sonchi]
MLILQIITWLLALAVLLSVMWIVVDTWRNGISPMPASKAVRLAVAGEVNRVPGYGTIVEAGSGWGTLGLDIIRHCPGKRLTGIENSSLPLWGSQLLALIAARLPHTRNSGEPLQGRLRFIRGNIYRGSYADADMVICYLFPGAMERLAVKFRQELPPGAVVISVFFALPDMQPVRTVTCRDTLQTKLYVYSF